MEKESKKYKPTECTALCLDIRNFTPTLEKYPTDEFYELLHNVYCAGFNIANCFSKKIDKKKHFYINSTGDGFICVFFDDPNHHIKAYLMGVLLIKKLSALVDEFYSFHKDVNQDLSYKFGIGIESGTAVRIQTSGQRNSIETMIGDAINLAARIESKTKEYTDSPMIYGEALNQYLSMKLFGKDYNDWVERAKEPASEEELEGLNRNMTQVNADLLSDYLHKHSIKGHKPGDRLYKLSISLLNNMNPENWGVLNTTKMPAEVKRTFKELWDIDEIWDENKLLKVYTNQMKIAGGIPRYGKTQVEVDSGV